MGNGAKTSPATLPWALSLCAIAGGCSLDLPKSLPCSNSGECPPEQVCDVDQVCRLPDETLVCDGDFGPPEPVPGFWPEYDDVLLAGISADETVALLELWGYSETCDDPDLGCYDIAVATRETANDSFGLFTVVLANPEAEVALQLKPDGSGFWYSVHREATGWDILYTQLDGLELGAITESPLNTAADEQRLWVAPDESSAYLMRDWELVYVPDLGDPSRTLELGLYPSEFSFSADQLQLLYSSDNDSDSEDIYYSSRNSTDEGFSTPVLVDALSSDQDDTTPVIPGDGNTVYLQYGVTYSDGVPDYPQVSRRQCVPR